MTHSIDRLEDSTITATPNFEIGAQVKRSREAHGYSVEDLAVTCGLTDAEISRIEVGADRDPIRLRRIAAALQLPVSTLLPV